MTGNALTSAVALIQKGDFYTAEKELLDFTRVNSSIPQAWFLLGICQASIQKNPDAIHSLKTCIKFQTNNPEALNNLGVVLEREQKLNEAKEYYQKSIKVKPNYESAIFNLGSIYQSEKNYSTAIDYYSRALELNAKNVKTLNNIGLCYLNQNLFDEAHQFFKSANDLAPNDREIQINIATVLKKLQKYDEAISHLKRALSIDGPNSVVLNDLGVNFKKLRKFDEASSCFHKSLAVNPSYAEALINLGNLHKEMRMYDKAIEYYNKALHIEPSNYSLLMNKCGCLLNMGDLINGWKYYQYRSVAKNENAEAVQNLLATDFTDKKILLTREQGIGDELFFLRYFKKLSSFTQKIDYLTSVKIANLLKQVEDIQQVFTELPDVSHYDHVISVGDLPILFQGNSNDFPESLKFKADEAVISSVKKQLHQLGPPPYIGITWRAGSENQGVLFKHIDIELLFHALESIPATILILQRSPTQQDFEDIKKVANNRSVHNLADFNNDLPKMLALLNVIDDYIGVSNTNMHLLAALGKTAHVFVRHPPEWRWMVDRNESHWFPGFDIYRQDTQQNWYNAIQQLNENLKAKYQLKRDLSI